MFDFFNVSVVLAFAFIGFYRGFIKEISALIIFVLAVVCSLHFAIPIDYMLSKSIPFPLFSTILAHVIVFATILTTAKLFFLKTILQSVRFLSTGSDSILGAVLGGLKGMLVSLMIFSCLYISGAAQLLGLNDSWFYGINKALYKKFAIFVTTGEIQSLGNVKHVQNIDSEADDLESGRIEENISDDQDLLKYIISSIKDKANAINQNEKESLIDIALAIPGDKLGEIYSICCQNISPDDKASDDDFGIYVGSLVINAYKNMNPYLSDAQLALARKIDKILSGVRVNDEQESAEKKNIAIKVDKKIQTENRSEQAKSTKKDTKNVPSSATSVKIDDKKTSVVAKKIDNTEQKKSAPANNVVQKKLLPSTSMRLQKIVPTPKRKVVNDADSAVINVKKEKEIINKLPEVAKEESRVNINRDLTKDDEDDIDKLIEDSIRGRR